jgi:hypothetical protein
VRFIMKKKTRDPRKAWQGSGGGSQAVPVLLVLLLSCWSGVRKKEQNLLVIGTLELALLGDVDTIQELTDILVPDGGGLLDVGSRLGDVAEVVTDQGDLILLVLGVEDSDALQHGDLHDDLLAQEVADLDGSLIIGDNNVDGEMGVDEAHLVLVTLGDTDDHVVDQGADGAEASNVLALAVPDNEAEAGGIQLNNVHLDVTEVLVEGTTGTGDGDLASLDLDLDALGDSENLFLVDILHFVRGRLRMIRCSRPRDE